MYMSSVLDVSLMCLEWALYYLNFIQSERLNKLCELAHSVGNIVKLVLASHRIATEETHKASVFLVLLYD